MVRGKHTFKFGGLHSRATIKPSRRPMLNSDRLGGGLRWLQRFQRAPALTRPLYGIADLELQNMALGWGESQNIFKVRNVWHDVEFYAADNWRVTPRLTVEYGFRWSLLAASPYLSLDDRYTLFNPTAFDPALGTASCNGLLYSSGLNANPCTAAGAAGGVKGPNRGLMNTNYHTIRYRASALPGIPPEMAGGRFGWALDSISIATACGRCNSQVTTRRLTRGLAVQTETGGSLTTPTNCLHVRRLASVPALERCKIGRGRSDNNVPNSVAVEYLCPARTILETTSWNWPTWVTETCTGRQSRM